jgi:hypothetical protein
MLIHHRWATSQIKKGRYRPLLSAFKILFAKASNLILILNKKAHQVSLFKYGSGSWI